MTSQEWYADFRDRFTTMYAHKSANEKYTLREIIECINEVIEAKDSTNVSDSDKN